MQIWHECGRMHRDADTVTLYVYHQQHRCRMLQCSLADNFLSSCYYLNYMAIFSPLRCIAPRFQFVQSNATQNMIKVFIIRNLKSAVSSALNILHDILVWWSRQKSWRLVNLQVFQNISCYTCIWREKTSLHFVNCVYRCEAETLACSRKWESTVNVYPQKMVENETL